MIGLGGRRAKGRQPLSWAKTLVDNGLFVGKPPKFSVPLRRCLRYLFFFIWTEKRILDVSNDVSGFQKPRFEFAIFVDVRGRSFEGM